LSGRRRRVSGWALQASDHLGAPDQDAGLRSAEQLVAAEADQVRAAATLVLHDRLGRQAVPRRVEERAAAQVVDQEQPARARGGGQSAGSGAWTNPTTRKLLEWTRRNSAVSSPAAPSKSRT
jgi:hypothetical protein